MHRLFCLVAVAVLALVVVQPAHAACGTSFLITQTGYVTGPSGTTYTYDSQPAFSANGRGAFWSLGHGNPFYGLGNDNGAFGAQNWVQGIRSGVFANGWYNYAPIVGTNWAASALIDGCIGLDGPNACTCVLLMDENTLTAEAVFTLGSALRDSAGNYTIQGNMEMHPVPAPVITGSTRNGTGVDLRVMVAMPAAGSVNQDPMCNCLGGSTFDVYALELPRGSPAPSARDIGAGWLQISSSSTPLGTQSAVGVVTSPCTTNPDGAGDTDLWLAAVINFDPASAGGFPNTYMSANSTMIECGVTLAEPEPIKRDRLPRRQRKRQRIR